MLNILMALKPFLHPFSFVIFTLFSFILIFSPINGHANSPSPSHFNPKTYLKRYGYLEYARANIVLNDEESDDEARIMESAIKIFQENFHIKPTGILDFETLTAMNTPRCGVPDFITWQARSSSKFATFPGSPKWSKNQLSYILEENIPEAAKSPLELALNQWQNHSNIIFSMGASSSDVRLGFYRRDHGDDVPFDGPGGIVGHAEPPEAGIVHFDAEENWCYDNHNGVPADGVDFEWAALHELGHMLGLAHSSVEAAIMWPSIRYGHTKTLSDDDIQGIRSLYG